ncbi:hypothetical protein AYO38_07375 [bacterium SCGC AG-212-C10]|nr:hypothetical protein AYO38_07375 [bacterium SCGC AG-212-C10]
MNSVIINLTARQVLGRRRIIFLLLAALVPSLIALAFRVSSDGIDPTPQEFASRGLYETIILYVLLPLCALVMGTSVLGGEIEDGTAVYLLAKPVPRYEIIISKLVVAWAATSVLVVISSLVSGLIVLAGEGGGDIIIGFTVAVVLGAFAYSCLFLMLSVMTSRALIAGLIYVFVWEGVVTSLFRGTKFLSVRQYSVGVADQIASLPREARANLNGIEALLLIAIVSAFATLYAVRRLQRFEIGESS